MGRFKELDAEYIYASESPDLNFDFMPTEKNHDLELYLQRKIQMLEELKRRLLSSESTSTSHL